MPFISTERLSGLIAGACLIRASESLRSALNIFFIPTTNINAKIVAVTPGLIAASVVGLLGCAYFFFAEKKRWLQIVALIVFSLAACDSISRAAVSISMNSPESMRTSIFIGEVIRLCISLTLLTCVVVMMKRSDTPRASG